MAYLAYGECFRCGKLFSFNPDLVPSIPVTRNAKGEWEVTPIEQGGVRQPVCKTCVDAVNPVRIKGGLPPIIVLPGAYEPVGEPDDKEEG